ncbi:MAG: hypothetical protein OXE02_03075 [Chloroflexi bacterium]|nr:hypothetical protein [Chloroflexota bacterium]
MLSRIRSRTTEAISTTNPTMTAAMESLIRKGISSAANSSASA